MAKNTRLFVFRSSVMGEPLYT